MVMLLCWLQILLGRSEKRQLGCRKGNTFSIAHFGDGGGELEPEQEAAEPEGPAKDAKAFWSELLPEAAAEHAARANSRKEPEVRSSKWMEGVRGFGDRWSELSSPTCVF